MMADKQKMTDEALEMVARRFKILSEPIRLRLLQELMEEERNVTELIALTGFTQSNISKHLGILLTAGMVSRRRNGPCAVYAITDPSVYDMCTIVCRSLSQHFEDVRISFNVEKK
jgi:DNA-binding transcriptional ArsR family regulator